MKVAINKCFGGFSLSQKVYEELGIEWDKYGYLDNKDLRIESYNYHAYRSNERLIAAIEKVGEKESSGAMANIRIVEIPDDIEWDIGEYDGMESIEEAHRSWS